MMILDNQKFGPIYRFKDSDVFCLLESLYSGKSISRVNASCILDIGEGSVRKLIDLLKENGIIDVRQTGMFITRYGKEMIEILGIRSVNVDACKYVIGEFQYGVIVSHMAEKVYNGIEQRNLGIRAGGDGCTTWMMKDENLIMLPDWSVDDNDPDFANIIRDSTEMREGDVLIIGGGPTIRSARSAAVDAALGLI